MEKSPSEKKPKVFYKRGTPYAVTINPSDAYQYYGYKDRYQRWREYMSLILEPLTKLQIMYEFHAEISEPTLASVATNKKGPRLHVHGTVIFTRRNGLRDFLMDTLPNWAKTAMIDIDTIEDMNIWQEYCEKQKLFNKRFTNCQYDEDNIYLHYQAMLAAKCKPEPRVTYVFLSEEGCDSEDVGRSLE